MERSDDWNNGIPFNYFLIDLNDKGIVSFLVNDYVQYDNLLYFTEVDGGLDDDFCHRKNELKLSKIDLNNNLVYHFIPINNENKYRYI